MTNPMMKDYYRDKVVPQLMEKLGAKNPMEIPKLKKIVLNMGVGASTQNSKLLDEAAEVLSIITGQKPIRTRAKKAISNFKLREGMPIGVKVTLHGNKMWEFLYRLIHLTLPRVKDFRGISTKGFDGRGNYNLGIKEHIVFLEVDYDKVSKVLGMDVNFVTSSKTDADCRELLTSLGMPFRRAAA